MGHKLLELDSVEELAAYICRRAQDLCGADRAVLYLLHHDQTAEIVALNGWDARWLGAAGFNLKIYFARTTCELKDLLPLWDIRPGFRRARQTWKEPSCGRGCVSRSSHNVK